MKKTLQNRLTKYSAAAFAVVGAAGANAQIVYTDVDPDYNGNAPTGDFDGVAIDLNNDATIDFVVGSVDTLLTGGRLRTTYVLPYGTVGNAIAGETPSGYDYALALDMGAMIDNTLNWISATNTMAYNVDSANPYSENWNGVTDKYLGLQFKVGANTHYGWARLDVQAIGDIFTLKDYAYNATAGAGLTAGQTAGLLTEQMDAMVHFVNQADNSVKVVINSNLTNGVITVVSATGAVVSTGNVDGETFTVDMNGLSSGIYMINASFTEGSITKKMIVH
jgi:hypothetical protein